MSDEKEPTQRTEKGHEIPVPKRRVWDKLLRKVATPKPPNGERQDRGRPPESS